MKRAASGGGFGVKKAKLEAKETKGNKEKANQLTELNKSVQDLVNKTKRIREGRDEDRHLAKLFMLMEYWWLLMKLLVLCYGPSSS